MTLDRVYTLQMEPHSLQALDHKERHSVFQLYMAFALGSIRSHHTRKDSPHPFGFFTAALQLIAAPGFCFNSLDDIVDFLLIARFGVYYYIGRQLPFSVTGRQKLMIK